MVGSPEDNVERVLGAEKAWQVAEKFGLSWGSSLQHDIINENLHIKAIQDNDWDLESTLPD